MTEPLRKFSEITERLVRVGDRWWGELLWTPGGSHGCEVRRFATRELLDAYVSLNEQAFLWVHEDHDAWHTFVVCDPVEIGDDFVIMERWGGVPLPHFDPTQTDDVVERPGNRIEVLQSEVARMVQASRATQDARGQFVATLIENRVATQNRHIIFDLNDHLFHIDDLDPDEVELSAWQRL